MSWHTLGPWTHYDDSVNPQHRHMIAAMGKTVAHIYCTNGDEIADKANARLIAAAPDLLEALMNSDSLLQALGTIDDPILQVARRLNRAAIAKAEGK